MIQFDLPKDQSSIIKVIGVGGGGSNAVNHMYNQGIKGVDFIVCNTDAQALDISPIPVKVQLGASLTEGLGAGAIAEVGRNAAIENIDDFRAILEKNTKMVFVTAGMGGGTGTGGAPVIAQLAREMGILTVGIVTVPFIFEGRKRRKQAEEGIAEMRNSVDTLLVINNDKLREMFGNLSVTNAFSQADDVVTGAARGIAEIITRTGGINVDFNDVSTVMKDSGVAIMGSAAAEGEERAVKAISKALASPLLNDNDIKGANYVLLNIAYGNQEVLMDEIAEITDYIQEEAGSTADVIWGHGFDDSLGEKLSVTIIATGFDQSPHTEGLTDKLPEKKYHSLEAEVPTMITKPVENPTEKTEREEPSVSSEQEDFEPFIKGADPQNEDTSSIAQKAQGAFDFNMEPAEKEEESVQQEFEQEQESPDETKEVTRYYLDDLGEDEVRTETTTEAKSEEASLSPEEMQQRAQERISRIRDLSMRLKTPSGIADLENEPAYKRRKVDLKQVPHSSESQVSRYTLTEEEDDNGERKMEIKPNNPFLHDNVD